MKSSKSWMVEPAPKGAIALQILNPNTQGRERTIISTRFTATAFPLFQLNKSMEKLMIFSNTAMIVDKAAKLINTKNRVPKILPPAIWLKILGRVTNTSPGPSPGFTWKAKQAGKIIKPASRATRVSKTQIRMDSPVSV